MDPYTLFLGKYGSFTEIQSEAFAELRKKRHCMIIAPTGSGKTEAALLPVLERIRNEAKEGITALYITPLRALNRDLRGRIEWLADALGVSVGVRHGDTTRKEREEQARRPPMLVVTTPESLQNLFMSARLRRALGNVHAVVVDEVHELYSNKRGAQLAVALERLVEVAGEFQRIGLSATISNPGEASLFLFGGREYSIVESKSAKLFDISVEMPLMPRFEDPSFSKRFGLDKAALARIERVKEVIDSSEASIVFANTRSVVESLGSKLILMEKSSGGEGIGIHHSSLEKDERIEIERRFKGGMTRSIVATSSLELGIDIGRIEMVVQYGSPRQATRLAQRIGRGGHRQNAISSGIIIVSSALEAIEAAVITDAIGRKEFEKHGIEERAYDVLVNQACAMTMEYGRIDVSKMHTILKMSSPYIGLTAEALARVLFFAAEEKLIRLSDGIAYPSFRSREYFIKNISVIPDSKKFYVKEIIGNRIVSTLDEKFVYSNIAEGEVFITKGVPWRVVAIEEDKILVEPSEETEAAVPDWEGEDIPVSSEIAEGVRKVLAGERIRDGLLESKAAAEVEKFIVEQRSFFVPEKGMVVMEAVGDYAIIYSFLGKKANELFARIVAGVLGSYAAGISVHSTPYAVVINYEDSGKVLEMKRVVELLRSAETGRWGSFVKSSELFRYKFVQVAKLFGIIEKKAVVTKDIATRVAEFYRDSPVGDETLRDLDKNYFDSRSLEKMLRGIKAGDIGVLFYEGNGSPLSEEVLRSAFHYREFLSPSVAKERDIEEFTEKFSVKDARLLCTYCGLIFVEKVDAVEDKRLSCPSCGSAQISMYSEDYADALRMKKDSKKMGSAARLAYGNMIKEAGLVSAYGSRAVVAMMTYGIGLSTAGRILKMVRGERKRFIVDLIEAQKAFVRTSRFWKGKGRRPYR